MPTATLKIGSSRQLQVLDAHVISDAYSHPTMLSSNGVVYGSLKDVPANTQLTDANYWVVLLTGGMVWKGAWQAQEYTQYQAVQYQQGVYIVKAGETAAATETPAVATGKWDILLEAPNNNGTANTIIYRDQNGDAQDLAISAGNLSSKGDSSTLAFVPANLAGKSVIKLAGGSKHGQSHSEMGGAALLNDGTAVSWGYTTSNMYGRSRDNGHSMFPETLPAFGIDHKSPVVDVLGSVYLAAVLNENGEIAIQHSTNSKGTAGQGFAGVGAVGTSASYTLRKADLPAGLNGKIVRLFSGRGGSYSHGGYDVIFGLSDQGEVIAVGDNSYGQCGIAGASYHDVFKIVNFPEAITDISVGDARYTHVMFLGASGHVYFTGYCNGGRKGDNNNGSITTPQRDDALIAPPWGSAKVTQISAQGTSTNGCSIVLCDNGKMYHAGYNSYGNGGTGNTTANSLWKESAHTAADIVEFRTSPNVLTATFFKVSNGDWYGYGKGYGNGTTTGTVTTPAKIDGIGTIREVITMSNSSGYIHTVYDTDQGMLINGYGAQYSMGNRYTTNKETPIALHIAAGFGELVDGSHVGYSSNPSIMLLGSNGIAYGSGYNGHAQLGKGNTTQSYTFSHKLLVN